MTHKMYYTRKYKIGIITGMLLIFFLASYGFLDAKNLHIVTDELAYWGNAAVMAGYDWSYLLTALNSYYSYGYSLILVPLFWMFDEPARMYQVAILMNAAMISLCFPLSIGVGKRIFPYIENKKLYVAGFVTCTSTAYLVQAHTAWTESLLIFLFWILIYFLCNIIDHVTDIKIFVIAVLVGYIYMVHMRTISLVIALTIVIIFMSYKSIINKKQVVIYVGTLVGMLIMATVLESIIRTNVYANTDIVSSIKSASDTNNTYKTSIDKLLNMLSVEGMKKFLGVLFGQMFYQGLTTQITAYISYIVLFVGIIKNIINCKKQNSAKIFEDKYIYMKMFLILAVTGGLFVSSIFMSNPGRIDQVIYGRYLDNLMGPLYFIGLLLVFEVLCKKEYLIKSVVLITIVLLMGYIANITIKWEQGYNQMCSPWVVNYLENDSLLQCSLLLLFIVFMIICFKILDNKLRGYSFLFIAIVCFGVNMYPARTVIKAELATEKNWYDNGVSIKNYLVETSTSADVLFLPYTTLTDENKIDYIQMDYAVIGRLQFQLDKYKIIPIYELDEFITNTDVEFLLTYPELQVVDSLYEYAQPVVTSSYWILWKKYDENTGEEQIETYISSDSNTNGNFVNVSSDGWMTGSNAYLFFNINDIKDYEMIIQSDKEIPFNMLDEEKKEFTITILVNNEVISTLVINEQNNGEEINFILPAEAISVGVNQLEISIDNTWSPAEYGSADTRELGIAIENVTIISQ